MLFKDGFGAVLVRLVTLRLDKRLRVGCHDIAPSWGVETARGASPRLCDTPIVISTPRYNGGQEFGLGSDVPEFPMIEMPAE